MDEIKRRILAEGQNLGQGNLKVDSFLNHQIDTQLLFRVGQEMASHFADVGVTKIFTAEISGIAPALFAGYALNVPVLYARKTRPVTMTGPVYVEMAPSHTRGGGDEYLMVSAEFLGPDDHVLVVDDFLSSGSTIEALVRLVEHAGATLVGVAAVIEKRFDHGREELEHLGVPIVSLAIVTDMTDGKIVME